MSEPSFFSLYVSWVSFFSKGKSKAEGQHLFKNGEQGQWQLGELDKSGKGQGHSLVQPGGPRIPAERILSKECLLSRKS